MVDQLVFRTTSLEKGVQDKLQLVWHRTQYNATFLQHGTVSPRADERDDKYATSTKLKHIQYGMSLRPQACERSKMRTVACGATGSPQTWTYSFYVRTRASRASRAWIFNSVKVRSDGTSSLFKSAGARSCFLSSLPRATRSTTTPRPNGFVRNVPIRWAPSVHLSSFVSAA